jgi:hypothetical protein
MEIITYILSYNGNGIAVIRATTIKELLTKLTLATREELSLHADDVEDYEVVIKGRIGDFGETTEIVVTYTCEDLIVPNVTDNEFTLTKTVSY